MKYLLFALLVCAFIIQAALASSKILLQQNGIINEKSQIESVYFTAANKSSHELRYYFDVATVEVKNNDRVEVTITSKAFDPSLFIINPDGSYLDVKKIKKITNGYRADFRVKGDGGLRLRFGSSTEIGSGPIKTGNYSFLVKKR